MDVKQAVEQRISTRAFLDTPLPLDEVKQWLLDAQRAPSGGNLQPARIIALAGDAKQGVVDMAAGILATTPGGEPTDRPVYPENLWAPHTDRRRRVGHMMYDAIGIPKEDKVGRMMWFARNFEFFQAPLALFFVIDERMGHGQWSHTGMLMQTLALLAEERGWATCMQECWGMLRPSLKEHLGVGATEMVYCGMAVGIPDPSDPVNSLRTERAPIEEYAEFRGF